MDFTIGVAALKDEGAYKVLAAAQALEAQGKHVVHLEIGQPDFPTPQFICEAGIQALRQGKTQYCGPSGIAEIKEAIAKQVSTSRGIDVTAENVVVGPGAKPGMWFAVQALVREGDEVLIPDPGFPTYSNMVKAFGGVPRPFKCIHSIDVEEIKAKINENTRMIVLNSPSNPTGAVLTHEQLQALANVCKSHPKLWVISDEIYSQLLYVDDSTTGRQAPSIASLPGMLERTIIVDGFSKTFSMTGWRLGYVVCNPSLARRLHLLMTHAVGCTATFTQLAGVEALTSTKSANAIKTMVEEYRKRRDYVVQRLNDMPNVSCAMPQGAFYVFPDISKLGVKSEQLSDRCLKEGLVAVLPGTDFGANGEGYLRLSYVTDLETLKEGLDRIEKVIRSYNGSQL